MNVVAAIGATSLGIVVGWLLRYFIRRFKTFTPKTFSVIISLLFGGAIVNFFDADKSIMWFYPIGLLIGFALYTILAILAGGLHGPGVIYGRIPK